MNKDLLKRVRRTMQAHYNSNKGLMGDVEKADLLSDIGLIDEEIGGTMSTSQVMDKLNYMLDYIDEQQTLHRGLALEDITRYQLECVRDFVNALEPPVAYAKPQDASECGHTMFVPAKELGAAVEWTLVEDGEPVDAPPRRVSKKARAIKNDDSQY